MDGILQSWEDFARTIEPPALTMDDEALRDHARQMLLAFADDLDAPQTEQEAIAKSQGLGKRDRGDTAAETHAEAHPGHRVELHHAVAGYPGQVRDRGDADVRQRQAHEQTDQRPDRFHRTHRGPVIPQERIGSIFDPLVRLAASANGDAAGDRERTSLGIGLFISREIAHAHGGNLAVASDAADGTTFTVTLQRRPGNMRWTDAAAAPSSLAVPR